jgi:hypothetical protein
MTTPLTRTRPEVLTWPAPAWADVARFPVAFRSAGATLPDGTNSGWCSGCLADFPAGTVGCLDTYGWRWCAPCVSHVTACTTHGCCIP